MAFNREPHPVRLVSRNHTTMSSCFAALARAQKVAARSARPTLSDRGKHTGLGILLHAIERRLGDVLGGKLLDLTRSAVFEAGLCGFVCSLGLPDRGRPSARDMQGLGAGSPPVVGWRARSMGGLVR